MNRYILPIVYAIIIVFLIGLFFNSFFTVSCQISLIDNEVIEGNDVQLFYEIDNKMLFDDIFDVDFKYWVVHGEHIVVPYKTVKIPKISVLENYKSVAQVNVSNLDTGKYTIWTQTTYYVGIGGIGIGNKESKWLSLDFYII